MHQLYDAPLTVAGIFVLVACAILIYREYGHCFASPEPPIKDTPYAPPLRYSVYLLKAYQGRGLLKAMREAYPYMPITVAKNMIAPHRVELLGGSCISTTTNLVRCILKHAPDCCIRVQLDGTDIGFTLTEWAEVHCETT